MPIATGQLPGNLVTKPHNRKWWKSATVYQIYPASFKDGNGVSNRHHDIGQSLG